VITSPVLISHGIVNGFYTERSDWMTSGAVAFPVNASKSPSDEVEQANIHRIMV
jgi:hypothetical protein